MIRASHRRGLSRIDVAVVVGIGTIALGVLLPALQQVRAGGKGRECQNNLRLMALAAHNHHSTFNYLPAGMDNQYVGALIQLLPYLEQDILYRDFSFDRQYDQYWQNPNNRPATDGTDIVPPPENGRKLYGCEWDVNAFLCPEAPQPDETATALMVTRYGIAGVDYRDNDGLETGHIFSGSPGRLVMARSHYLGIAGDWRMEPPYNGRYRGMFRYNARGRGINFFQVLDGLSNTIMFGEYWGGFIDWSATSGVPSGWSTPSRSAGLNYGTFGPCPNPANPNCDLQSYGLSFGTFGALHFIHTSTGPRFGFNVAMGDGSVRMLRGDIDFGVWEAMCGIADGEIRPRGLEPDTTAFTVDPINP